MWSPQEQALLERTTFLIGTAEYERALESAEVLCELVRHNPVAHAYVLGCKKAVALRGLGWIAEAGHAFRTAYQAASLSGEPVIAAYIAGDWSLMLKPSSAVTIAQRALSALQCATATPDPDRMLPADIAYLTAILARHLARYGKLAHASVLFSQACANLRSFAASTTRYQNAYLVALMWQREFGGHDMQHRLAWRFRINFRVFREVLRQKKVVATIKLLLSHRRMRRLRANVRS